MRRPLASSLVAIAIASATGAAPASANLMQPQSAAGFRNSIGVNTHVGYTNTAYANWSGALSALAQLGVAHVRDLVVDNGVTSYMNQWTANVLSAASRGIKFDFVMPEPGADLGTIPQLVSALGGPLRSAVDAIEDPNEYDLTNSGAGWASTLSAYDQQVYTAVRGTPSLDGVPVIGPSLVHPASYSTLGNQSSLLDDGNIHPYTAGQPSTTFIDSALASEGAVSADKPVWVTEFGYNNAIDAEGGDPPVSDTAAAAYLLRTYLLNYLAGVPRTYAYELLDEQSDPGMENQEEHFGLMNNDLTPKPAYTALKNLLAVIGTPAAPAALTPINVDLSGAAGVSSVLLEVDASHYELVLWQGASVWNSGTLTDVDVPNTSVNVDVSGAVSAGEARPLVSDRENPVSVTNGAMTVEVPADPVVVSLTLGSTPDPGAIPGQTTPQQRVDRCRGVRTLLQRELARANVVSQGNGSLVLIDPIVLPCSGTVRLAVVDAAHAGGGRVGARRPGAIVASIANPVRQGRTVKVRLRYRLRSAAGQRLSVEAGFRRTGARRAVVADRPLRSIGRRRSR